MSLEWNFSISAFQGSGNRGGCDLESRVSNSWFAKSQRVKGKILENLRDNSCWAPILFQGFETQEVQLHGQHNSRNREERNVERWVPSIN
jgi:hypothetical protein